MTAHLIDKSPVTLGLKAMLLAGLAGQGAAGRDLLVEVGMAPINLVKDAQNRLVDPYAIIYQLNSLDLYGSLAHPENGGTLVYQITSAGRTDESAEIMDFKVRRLIAERDGGRSFVHVIDAGPGMTVVDRRTREIGMSDPVAGLWQSISLYELEVQANA